MRILEAYSGFTGEAGHKTSFKIKFQKNYLGANFLWRHNFGGKNFGPTDGEAGPPETSFENNC